MRGILFLLLATYLSCSAVKVGTLKKCGCSIPAGFHLVADSAGLDRSWCNTVDAVDTGYSLNDRLIRACIKGDMGLVKELVTQGANTSYTDMFSRTPLMYAARFNHTEVVEFLCSNGADVNAKPVYTEEWVGLIKTDNDYLGGSALLEAALNGNTEMVRILLDHGADVNQLNAVNNSALAYAAREGNTGCAKLLLDRDADVSLAVGGKKDKKALLYAISRGRSGAVDLLLRSKAISDTDDMVNALKAAVEAGNLEMLCRLFKSKAKVYYEWKDRNNNYQRFSPLAHASERGDTVQVDFLLCRKAPLDESNGRFYPITLAAKSGHAPVVKRLVAKGAPYYTYDDNKTTLHWAVEGGNVEVVKQIAGKIGSKKLLAEMMSKGTIWSSRPEIFRYLFERATDSLNMSIQSEAFYRNILPALKNCSLENIGHLLDSGVPVNLESLDRTRLMVEAARGNIEGMKKAMGADNPRNLFRTMTINTTARKGESPLYYAIVGGHPEAVRLLVENGADIHAACRNDAGSATMLGLAFYYGQVEIARYLAEKGAVVNRKGINTSLKEALDNYYKRPSNMRQQKQLSLLTLSVISGDSSLFHTVLDRNDPDYTHEDYLMTFLFASFLGHSAMAELLFDRHPFITAELYNRGEAVISVGGLALLMAAGNGHLNMVKKLTTDPFPKTAWNKHLPMASRAAAYSGHREIDDLILRRALGDD